MAGTVIVDSGFVIALLRRRDTHREWAASQASQFPPPWHTCEAALSEAFHLLKPHTTLQLSALLRRHAVLSSFVFAREQEPVLALMQKYADVPMSLADACLVRMSETHPDPIVLTTDADFRAYRRHSRQVVPCALPT
ncbi:MAG TPA: PIN domain-containing protein [Steroidobacteraceae bacterium]